MSRARDVENGPGPYRRPAEARSFAAADDWPAAPGEAVEQRMFAREDRAFAVIPCLNEAAHVAPLISHLLADEGWVDPLIVVADGGSTDGTIQIVSQMALRDGRIRVIHNPAKLQSAAVNLAAARFGGDRRWMARIDAHAGYPPNYVSGLIEQARCVGAASVVVSMRTEGHSGFQRAAAAAQNSLLGAGGSPHRRTGRSGWVDHGHHALFDLSRFREVGGYDEALGANEDAEFDVRLGRARGRIWLSHELQVTYYPRARAADLFRQYLNYGQGRGRTLLRHHVAPKIRQLLPVAVAPAVAMAPLAVLAPLAAAPALIWAALSLGCGALLAVRGRDPALAGAGIAAMIMHLGWSLGFWRALFEDGAAPAPTVGFGRRGARP